MDSDGGGGKWTLSETGGHWKRVYVYVCVFRPGVLMHVVVREWVLLQKLSV